MRSPTTWHAWAQQRGGLVTEGPQVDRVRQATARVTAPTVKLDSGVQFYVLNSSLPTANAWPDGSIFIARGLIDRLHHDDELAAAIAHEIGHLIADRHLHTTSVASLTRPQPLDAERRADQLGVQLMGDSAESRDAMTRMLRSVAQAYPSDSPTHRSLHRRAAALLESCPCRARP